MMLKEQEFVNEIQNLFQTSQLKECINRCEEYSNEFNEYSNYQIVQLFRSMSYFETTKPLEGHRCIQNLIKESKIKKGDKIEQIDLVIKVLYLWELFDENTYKAEELNEEFLKQCEEYQIQNSEKDLNVDGIYLLAKGMSSFIDTFRDDSDMTCIQSMMKSLNHNQQFSLEIQNLLGWMYDYKSKTNESLSWFLAFYEKHPLYPGAANNIGLLYKQLEDYEKAEKYLIIANEICPINTVILNNLGMLFQTSEDIKNQARAEAYFKNSYEINQQSVNTCLQYGRYLYRQNKKLEGLELLNKGLELNPYDCEIYMFLATQGKEDNEIESEQYVEYIQKCIDYQPKEGYYYYLMADHYLQQNQYEKAIDYFNQTLSRKLHSSTLVSASSRIAYCYYNLDRIEDCLKQYIKTLNYFIDSDYQDEIESIAFLLDGSQISYQRKIEILDSFNDAFLMRLSYIISLVENKQIKAHLELKLSYYKQINEISAYQKYIQPNLFFQNEISHWDLSID